MTELLRVERDAPRPGSWRLILDDPPRANALSPSLVEQLYASLHAAVESDARAIVLESSSDCFCSGSDLSDVDGLTDSELRARFGTFCAEGNVASRVDDILRASSSLDAETLRAILRVTRDTPSERDRNELLRSTWREGLAERIHEHARRAGEARAARRIKRE